jgi:hypothetical protein
MSEEMINRILLGAAVVPPVAPVEPPVAPVEPPVEVVPPLAPPEPVEPPDTLLPPFIVLPPELVVVPPLFAPPPLVVPPAGFPLVESEEQAMTPNPNEAVSKNVKRWVRMLTPFSQDESDLLRSKVVLSSVFRPKVKRHMTLLRPTRDCQQIIFPRKN